MNADTLLENFEILAEAPGGVDRLRELILGLAVSGEISNSDLSSWRTTTLGEEVQIVRGITFPASAKGRNPGKGLLPCLRTANIQNEVDWVDLLYVSEEYVRNDDQYVQKYDLLISMANSRELVGKVALVDRNDITCTLGGFIAAIRCGSGIDPKYLKAILRVPAAREKLIDSSTQTTNIANISLGRLRPFVLNLPPLAEQHDIVTKVDKLMALCDQLEQQQKHGDNLRTSTRKSAIDAISTATTPEELATAWKRINNNWEVIADTPESVESLRALVFDLAIRGVLVAPDANDRPASELLKQIKDKLSVNSKRSELQPSVVDLEIDLPKIPLHWAWTSIQEIGKVNPRNEAMDDSTAGFVPMASVSANYSTPHQCEPRKWSSIKKGYTHLADGDIAVAKITPCFENGKSCVLSELPNGVGAGTTELLVVRPIIVAPKYILIFLKSSLFYGNGIPRMTGTAGQKRLPTEFFKSCPLPLPPLAEQIRIVAKVDELMALCDQLESELKSRSEVAEKFARSVVSAA
jgi:type I restriction enzyme S subunit